MPDFTSSVGHYMSYLVAKRNTVSNNIANANTPGYKAQDVTFVEQMENGGPLYKKNHDDLRTNPSLYQTSDMHLPLVSANNTYAKIKSNSLIRNQDGNSVDTSKEMIDLLKTNQLYSISVQTINTQYAINQAARGR
ncbi:flagellar basal body rod protein FlgB [Bacillus manliponensis]|uniref:flagellar basal body rod protein FlgB n=1 Tax=Bacillus manliponensis TaxID=574376 RepID=UPI003515B757